MSSRSVSVRRKPLRNSDPAGFRKGKRHYIGIAYCLPYVVVFLCGTILPMLYAFYLSLFKTQMIGGEQFAGIANFAKAIKDPLLWNGFGRVTLYAAIQVPLMLILSLTAALMLDSQRIKHVAVPRILLFLPYAVPGVVASLMWGYIYGGDYGLFGQLFTAMGLTPPDMFSQKLIRNLTKVYKYIDTFTQNSKSVEIYRYLCHKC